MSKPLYCEIPFYSLESLCHGFQGQALVIWLDSADHHTPLADRNRYSYLAIDPAMILMSEQGRVTRSGNYVGTDAFAALKQELSYFKLDYQTGLPPFQTGVAGYWAYDLVHYLEPIPFPQQQDMPYPEMMVGFYDLIIAADHFTQRMWIISSGYPETNEKHRLARAQKRLSWLKAHLMLVPPVGKPTIPSESSPHKIISNCEREEYEIMVDRVIEYIRAGDIFEANLSQRFSTQLPKNYSYFDLYRHLRKINAAPFAAYIQFNDRVIASASPERFLKLVERCVETRPIKGTHKRHPDPVIDQMYANQLLSSEKDRAENIMIVDLMRNDLSKVCQDESVKVTQLCGLETFKAVHHLVSVIVGKLRDDVTTVDLLQAAFPGGSITGAPKIRAMQIIAELEPHRRGPYCGNIGYISFHGDMDTSIVIRTFVGKGNVISFHGGGAIVIDSDPHTEYQETCTKTHALQQALLNTMRTQNA